MGARFRFFRLDGTEAPGRRSFPTVRGALKVAATKAKAERTHLVVWMCLDGITPATIGGVARADGRVFRVPDCNAVPPVRCGDLVVQPIGGAS